MKSFNVLLTRDAAGDLDELYDYIAEHDAPSKAGHVLDRIQKVIDTLATFPLSKELLALGIWDYRQTFFKPCRVIYRIIDQKVYVFLIADGRRDMQVLLERRLSGA